MKKNKLEFDRYKFYDISFIPFQTINHRNKFLEMVIIQTHTHTPTDTQARRNWLGRHWINSAGSSRHDCQGTTLPSGRLLSPETIAAAQCYSEKGTPHSSFI